MKIAIVVLNFNGLNNTLACLESLKKLKKNHHDTEIIIVDNGSSDGSCEALRLLKNIILIENQENFGYTGGNNVGIQKSLKKNADFVLVLNNDTLVDPSLITNLLAASRFSDIIAPKIYFERGFEFHKERYPKKDLGRIIWYAGGKIDWQNIIGIHIGVDEVDKGQFHQQHEIDFATGACLFVKRQVFESIGLFDEKYFLYLEDMDLCVRAKRAGFKILYEPKAILWHKNALSIGGSGSQLQDYYITRNRLLFAFKYATVKTKLALFRNIVSQIGNPVKRRALFDFLTFNFGKGGIR